MLHLIRNMSINIECEGCCGVSEVFLDGFDVVAALDRSHCVTIFFNFGVLFYAEDAVNICLNDQQFFHFISGLAVFRILFFFKKTRDKNALCAYTEKVKKQKRGLAVQIWKEEVKYIEDTPIRIILDDEISILKGKLPPHWHNEIEIDLVLQGSVYYIVNGTSYHVAKDEIVIVDSSVIHSGRCSDGSTVEETHAEVMTVQINKDVFRYANYTIPSFQVFLSKQHNAKLRAIMAQIKDIYEKKAEYYELLLNSEVLKLCYCLLINHSIQNETQEIFRHTTREIKRAIQYVEHHCSEKLNLGDVASFIHYNPSYFSRRFHQFTGFTFNEYLNRCRIDAASKMLLETEKTISEIGLECGFPSVSSFITFFKRQHQVTPEKYRKSYSHERVKK